MNLRADGGEAGEKHRVEPTNYAGNGVEMASVRTFWMGFGRFLACWMAGPGTLGEPNRGGIA